jgi:hypothetical protein
MLPYIAYMDSMGVLEELGLSVKHGDVRRGFIRLYGEIMGM